MDNQLFYTQKHAADVMSAAEKAKSDAYCADYMAYMDASKT